MQLVDDVEQQQLYWDNLVARIAAREPGGKAEFRATYRPGIHFLLRRRLGEDQLEQITDDTVNEILGEIAAGRLSTIADMARLIRKVMPRGRPVAKKPARSAGNLGATTDRERPPVLGQTQTLDQALAQFNASEREALVSYYARGFSERDVEAEFGFDAVAFQHLRERLVRAFHGARARRGTTMRRGTMYRTAAGGAA